MADVLERIQRLTGELGWCNAGLYLLARGLDKATRGTAKLEIFRFVAQPVPDQPLLGAGRGATIEIHPVTTSEDPVCRFFPRPAEVIRERFKQNVVCFVAQRHGQFVGYLWLALGSYDEDVVRTRFVLPESNKVVWDFDVYVEPASRMGFTFLRLWDAAYEWMRSEGYRWSLSRISVLNPASFRAHQRLSAREIGAALFLCLGPLQLMLATCSPYLHLSWGRGRPVIRLYSPAAG